MLGQIVTDIPTVLRMVMGLSNARSLTITMPTATSATPSTVAAAGQPAAAANGMAAAGAQVQAGVPVMPPNVGVTERRDAETEAMMAAMMQQYAGPTPAAAAVMAAAGSGC